MALNATTSKIDGIIVVYLSGAAPSSLVISQRLREPSEDLQLSIDALTNRPHSRTHITAAYTFCRLLVLVDSTS
jgi:hypothetical protein